MRIIVNIKCRGGRIMIEPKMDTSSRDGVRELNAGKALYDSLNKVFSDMTADQAEIGKDLTAGKA